MWILFAAIDAALVLGLIKHAISPKPKHAASKGLPHWMFMMWLLAIGVFSGLAVLFYAGV